MSAKRPIKVAIAGNPNSGKSTIFNVLTGGSVSVGNWPGVTVEKHIGRSYYQGHEVTVVDLPGTYTLDAWTLDERIAREFLVEEKPDGVVAVVDASNLERNLYLVVQLLEMGARVIVALNMMDIARKKGLEIDIDRLAQGLKVRVMPTAAASGKGIEELRRAIHNLGKEGKPLHPLRIDYGEEIERGIGRVSAALENKVPEEERRWWALKLLEGESEGFELTKAEKVAATVRSELAQRHKHDASSAIVERRYGFIKGVIRECVRSRPGIASRLMVSDSIDDIVLNRWLGVPIFLVMMGLTFLFVFEVGTPVSELLGEAVEVLQGWATGILTSFRAPGWFISVLTDGIVEGVGSVLKFVPNIMILYLVITLLEDSGYMARAAFVMDRFMHALGLHGKSFIPMMMGFGCNVPAILATRTLESRKDRILTILVNPLMSCSARLPIYILFSGIFFSSGRWLVVFSLYLLGIMMAVVVGRLFRRLFFRTEAAPLIMELPPYHAPTLKTVFRPTWFRTWMFIRRAGVVIAPAVIVVWLFGRLPWGVPYASEESVLGIIGRFMVPFFKPTGFGYWWAGVSLLTGVVAKEIVVGTLATIHGTELTSAIRTHFTPISSYAFMVMSLLYIPCVATLAAIRRELGWRWAFFTAGYTLILGWIAATAIYQIGSWLLVHSS